MVLTIDGLNLIANRFAKATPDYNAPIRFRVGTGSTAATEDDTAMETNIPVQTTETIDACDATTGWTASGTNSIQLTNTRYREGTGALELIKSDVSSASILGSKILGAPLDFTSKDFWSMVYISTATLAQLATTGSVQVRFGSDSSNYYYKTYDKASLSAGWNFLKWNTTTATGSVGTPVVAASDYVAVQATTTNASDVFVADNFVFDDLLLASTDDYYKSFEASYPSVNETTQEVEIRCRVPTTNANGFNLTEFGIVNDDATEQLITHDTYTAISKDETDEIIYITKFRFDNT